MDAGLGKASYLHRPCGLQQAGNLCGSHSGQGLGGPGIRACSHHCHLHTGFSLHTRARGVEAKRRDGKGTDRCRSPSLLQPVPWSPTCG